MQRSTLSQATYSDVIFPNRPLFLVHKDWKIKQQNQKRAKRKDDDLRPRTKRLAYHNTGDTQETRYEKGSQHRAIPPSRRTSMRPRAHKSRPPSARPVKAEEGDVTEPLRIAPASRLHSLDNSITASQFEAPPSLTDHIILYANHYFHVIAPDVYPHSSILLFNPAKRDWLPRASTDEVWYFAILFVSARALATATGSETVSRDAEILLNEVLRRLSRRLQVQSNPSDETMGAVACLATWQDSEGNIEGSWIHAGGLAEMIYQRGGLSNIDDKLMTKVYRGILDIAVDADRKPLLQYKPHPGHLIGLIPGTPPLRSSPMLGGNLHPDLLDIYTKLADLCQDLENARSQKIMVDPGSLDRRIIEIQQGLLNCNAAGYPQALRICLLLFTKSLRKRIAHVQQSSLLLVQKLQEHLTQEPTSPRPLMLWKLIIGGMMSKDGTPQRRWYLVKLADHLSERAGKPCWSAIQTELRKGLWIGFIHDGDGKALFSQLSEPS